ncbi:NitT/TauT family transport system permease protein [Actinoplanes tereljensis]|uniref:ABC transporter permease n=1 Tax=Paractinoplanes tereljensis TaxID=571912 RepID=A0A919NQ57_9ACTN|nr:ABC transporter permease [Actinoplanes tereljensis]GIF23005.1 ABC transporter permease [Actinoplanes tereljensis]
MPAIGTIALIAAWWAAIVVLNIESYLAPTPPQVLAALKNTTGYLTSNAVTTLLEVVQGYLIAVGLGLAVGALLALSAPLERAFMPAIVAVNAIPKLAFAPLLLVWMGFGQGPKIVMVVLLCTFPILLASVAGLTRTPAELIELAQSLSANRWQIIMRFRLPSALPQIFVGLKTAMPLAVIGALVGELSGATNGLGFVIANAGADTATAFAAITLLAAISVGLFYLVSLTERLLLPWARAITD